MNKIKYYKKMGNSIKNFHLKQQEEILEKIHKEDLQFKKCDKLLAEIITHSASELQEKILKGNYRTLTEILDQFHHLKIIEKNETKSLTDVFYKKPLKRCKELQQNLKKDKIKKETYPLIGFYISIKECLKLKNSVSTHGFIVNLQNKISKQEETIQTLITKGAIITSRGNVPQACFSMECYNHVYGRSLNPYNPLRVPGGSSGGDAALVRLGLVNAAIGSDIAGSLRIPALFCGLVTLKSTMFRLSSDLLSDFFLSHEWGRKGPDFSSFILPVIGPMTRSVEDCKILMEVLVNDVVEDPFKPPMKWNMDFDKPKRVGVLKEFGFIEVSPPNKRGVNEAAEILKKSGIEIVELDLNDIFYELFINLNASYFKIELLKHLGSGHRSLKIKEPLVQDFTQFSRLFKIPKFLLSPVSYLMKKLGCDRQKIFVDCIKYSYNHNDGYLLEKRIELIKIIIKRMKNLKIESFLSFGLVTPAITHESFDSTGIQSFYTSIFNYLNFPVGVVPITKVKKTEEYYESKYNDVFTKAFKEVMKGSEGLPIGVQIASLPWMEEKCIKIMEILEKGVNEDFNCPFQKKIL